MHKERHVAVRFLPWEDARSADEGMAPHIGRGDARVTEADIGEFDIDMARVRPRGSRGSGNAHDGAELGCALCTGRIREPIGGPTFEIDRTGDDGIDGGFGSGRGRRRALRQGVVSHEPEKSCNDSDQLICDIAHLHVPRRGSPPAFVGGMIKKGLFHKKVAGLRKLIQGANRGDIWRGNVKRA